MLSLAAAERINYNSTYGQVIQGGEYLKEMSYKNLDSDIIFDILNDELRSLENDLCLTRLKNLMDFHFVTAQNFFEDQK